MDYLSHLNPPQREAVLHKDGPVLVVAGAGAGKTRTLVYRIQHLMKNGVAPETILAVTFTNKAANEMRGRIHALLGLEKGDEGEKGDGGKKNTSSPLTSLSSSRVPPPTPFSPFFTNMPFIGTFHALGIRILREKGGDIGIPKNFTVKDRDGALSLIKEAMDEVQCDKKKFEPRKVQGIISREKGELSSPNDYLAKKSGGYGAQQIATVWEAYDHLLKKEKSLDFDDLLVKPVRLLEGKKEARDYFRDKWRYIHIDEYQDTNRAQYILSKLLAEPRNNICAVGDMDQCLIAGTHITTAPSKTRLIETMRSGDTILSNYGSGTWRPAVVRDVFSRTFSGNAVVITTEGGRSITSTPEHIHFAGFRPKLTPQIHFVYLMYKQKVGFRLGTSQMYTKGQKQPFTGFVQRCNQEHGDSVWVLGTYDSPNKARENEYLFSLKYQIPTIPFVARHGRSTGGYVHDQHAINRIYKSCDTGNAGKNLLHSRGLSFEFPHHRAQVRNSNRRNIVVTLCGDKRGKTPMHRISFAGNDIYAKNLLSNAGFSVRAAKHNSQSWRFETCRADYGEILKITEHLRGIFPNTAVVKMARFGGNKVGHSESNSLAFLPAASVTPGMALFDEHGGYDVVKSVRRIVLKKVRVYDLNIEKTHNFIANGIVTHNSIYGWRGSSIRNILQFEKDYPKTKVVVLEENYRSTARIIRAANEIIGKNQLRIEKNLFTKQGDGEKISLFVSPDEKTEAFRVARAAKTLAESGGAKREDIAVLYRANFQSRALEEAFLALEVPYQVIGTRFFERKEVKDILAFLNAARNPDSLGDIKRVINVPPRGIGKTTIAKVFSGMRGSLPHAMVARVNDFYSFLARVEEASREKTVSDLVGFIFKESGLEAALQKEGEEGAERIMNIQELIGLAKRYEMLSKEKALDTFLEDTALLSGEDAEKEKKGGVRLMTVHAAKGLEFPYVFITGLEDGLFPHESFGDGGKDSMNAKERAEEERRLFYVAVTRAAKKLFLSYAETRTVFGSRGYTMPSPFIGDIPEELLELEHLAEDESIPTIEI